MVMQQLYKSYVAVFESLVVVGHDVGKLCLELKSSVTVDTFYSEWESTIRHFFPEANRSQDSMMKLTWMYASYRTAKARLVTQ